MNKVVAHGIGDVAVSTLVTVRGTIRATRVLPVGRGVAFDATLADDTGTLELLFLGRTAIAGIEPGARCAVDGRATTRDGAVVMWNPRFELIGRASCRERV